MEELHNLKYTGWIHEDTLNDLGLDVISLKSNSEVYHRPNGKGVEFFNASLLGYLIEQKVLDLKKIGSGIVDPIKLAMEMTTLNDDISISRMLEIVERDPSLNEERMYQGRVYKGIPIERACGILTKRSKEEIVARTDNEIMKTLEMIVSRNESISSHIPEISFTSGKYNPFQAVAYIYSNHDKMSPKQIANELGENPAKIELFLYKKGKLMLTNEAVHEKLASLKKGVDDNAKEYVSLSLNEYQTFSIPDFLRSTGMMYQDMKNLVKYNLLEIVTTINNHGRISKKITGRSALYHYRKMQLGDKEYLNEVFKVLSDIQVQPKMESRYNIPSEKEPVFWGHISQIYKFPMMTDNEREAHCKKIESSKKEIEKLVSSSVFMKEEMMRILNILKRGSELNFIKHFNSIVPNMPKEQYDSALADLLSKYNSLIDLYEKKSLNRDNPSLDSNIINTLLGMDVHYNVVDKVASRFRNALWDIKLAQLDIEETQARSKEFLSSFKDRESSQLAKSYLSSEKNIRKQEKRIESIEKDIEMRYESLESLVSKINEHTRVINSIKEDLLLRNLRLVLAITKGGEISYSYGVQGLMDGIDKFNYRLGAKFGTYATWWIKQRSRRGYADENNTIRLAVHIEEKINLISKVELNLMHKLGRNPKDFEIWQEYNANFKSDKEKRMNKKQFQQIREVGRVTSSLDAPIVASRNNDPAEETLLNFISNKTYEPTMRTTFLTHKKDFIDTVDDVFSTLTRKEEDIVRRRMGLLKENYGVSQSLEEIGGIYGVSRERIRQIEKKALQKLKHPTRKSKLESWQDLLYIDSSEESLF